VRAAEREHGGERRRRILPHACRNTADRRFGYLEELARSGQFGVDFGDRGCVGRHGSPVGRIAPVRVLRTLIPAQPIGTSRGSGRAAVALVFLWTHSSPFDCTMLDVCAPRRNTARMARYEDALTLRDARRRYFDANGFGDGGYDARWVKVKIGPLPLAFPNTPQRVRSVRLHDLHHVVTDYDTTMTGEAEIGAWEIASSCRDHWAAWVLNLLALGMGMFISPSGMWRAFVRGRRSRNLYDTEFDERMLGGTVGELRTRLQVGPALEAWRTADVVAFAGWSLASLLTLVLASAILLAPVAVPIWLLAVH